MAPLAPFRLRAPRRTRAPRRSARAARSARPHMPSKSKSSPDTADCTTPHIASRKSDMKRMSSSACDVCAPNLPEVRDEQRLAPGRIELVVDREVREVEEAVAHARVLPVDDAQPLAVIQEIRVQEVVVTRQRARRLRVSARSARRSRAPRSNASARGLRGSSAVCAVGLDHPERVERSGISGQSWNARSAAATRSSIVRLAHPLRTGNRSLDEPRHEPTLRLDEARPPPGRSRGRPRPRSPRARPPGRSRAGSCPSPRRAARTCSPSTSTFRLWFVMPPPSTSKRALPPGQTRSTSAANPLTRGSARPSDRRAARRRSTPATHSPKISTATSVPDTVLGTGRYAYAIDLSTV